MDIGEKVKIQMRFFNVKLMIDADTIKKILMDVLLVIKDLCVEVVTPIVKIGMKIMYNIMIVVTNVQDMQLAYK